MATGFFDLPAELRNVVYELAFDFSEWKLDGAMAWWPRCRLYSSILLVNRQFGYEAGSLYFSRHTPSYWQVRSYAPVRKLSAVLARYSPSVHCVVQWGPTRSISLNGRLLPLGLAPDAPWKEHVCRHRIFYTQRTLVEKDEAFSIITRLVESSWAYMSFKGKLGSMKWSTGDTPQILDEWKD
ncbi:hypothetical protein LTS18_008635 [Coniosporium uncinatum]|uniref:Uncharacterized protein n=1 Tax=Coniosporium uncinatum TaxID=93489 RepID=A0ACC3DMY6_9PEZI|nr:hypothetical protein LTS18_008635 [Coniosporium uncinatum]